MHDSDRVRRFLVQTISNDYQEMHAILFSFVLFSGGGSICGWWHMAKKIVVALGKKLSSSPGKLNLW